jgi:zinc protease
MKRLVFLISGLFEAAINQFDNSNLWISGLSQLQHSMIKKDSAITKAGFRILSCLVALILIPMCFSQSPQSPSRQDSARTAPFLQQVKLYEESTYVTKIVLKNGMKVLVNEYKGHPVVSIQAYVHSGFLNEPVKSPGISQLLAAMVNRGGTNDKSIGTLRQSVQALGGFFRESTDYENTQFEIVAPSAQWKKAMGLQAGAILSPSLDKDELKLTARMAADSARTSLSEPSQFAGEKLLELGFGQPRMGQCDTLAGSSLADFTRESLLDFHKSRYAAPEIMLVVSGDIISSDVLNEVARLYSRLSDADAAANNAFMPHESTQNEFRYRALRGNISTPRVLFGFHTASENANDYRALGVLAAILGLGKGSVLNSRLKDQKQLILSEETTLSTYADSGYLSIQMEVQPKDIDRSEIAVLTEIELLKREEPDRIEMERALAQLERNYWKSIETVTGRAQMMAHFERLGDWQRMDRYISDLRRVTPSDITRVAKRYLHLSNCSLLEYLPASGEERNLTTDSARQTLEGLLIPATDQEQAERAKEVVLEVKSPAEDGSFKFSEIQYPFQVASILRGPDIYIREDHTSQLIDIGIFYRSGKLGEKKENAGITKLMLDMMLRGSKEITETRFHRQLEIYGGHIQPVVAEDYFGFYFSILSKNMGAGFDLLRQVIKTPDFSKDAIDRQKTLQLAEIQCRKSSQTFPQWAINQALFKDFSYSIDSLGSESGVADITSDSLQSWYDTYVRNRKPIVAAAGDTSGTALASYFVKDFSGSRFQETKIPGERVKPLEKRMSIEGTWNRNESLILIGFQAPSEEDEERSAAGVLQSYAGEWGRFFQEIADRRGLAFKWDVDYAPRLRSGSMIVSATVNPENEEAALKALLDEIKRMTDDPIPFRDYKSALNEAVGAFEIHNQAHHIQIARLVLNVLAGKRLEEYKNYFNSLQAVKEEDLKDAARRIFNLDKAVILRLRGVAR